MAVNKNSSPRTWTWLIMLFAALLIGALALAAACGGDDDDSGDDGDDASPTATEPADDGDEPTDEPTDEPDDGDDGDDGDDAAQRLGEIADNYETFQGYVRYDVSGQELGLSTMAFYQDGDNSRFDIESDEGSVIIINTPDASYLCAEDQCIQYPVGDAGGAFGESFTDLVDADTIESEFVEEDFDYEVSSDNIAGLDATCFTASGDLDEDQPGDETGEVCFSDEGSLLLRISSESGEGTYTMEATEASTSVPGGSFDPPFDVIDFSDLGDLEGLEDLFDN